jgi:hypothetical protein
MSRAAAHRSDVAGRRSRLFKSDHPRGIDRYIDYFDGRPQPFPAGSDPCGEEWLERHARLGSVPR